MKNINLNSAMVEALAPLFSGDNLDRYIEEISDVKDYLIMENVDNEEEHGEVMNHLFLLTDIEHVFKDLKNARDEYNINKNHEQQ